MKKILTLFCVAMTTFVTNAQDVKTFYCDVDEIVVSHIYKSPIESGGVIDYEELTTFNYGQEPSAMFKKCHLLFH